MSSEAVRLGPGCEVIADLHLDPADPVACGSFAAWLGERRDLKRLVILGDLFDAWVGPAHAQLEGARLVLDGLRGVTDRGAAVDLLWGNRDFLLDDKIAALAGAKLHGDALVAAGEQGERVLFIHGDELCTLDTAYQRLRRVLRSRWVTGALLNLPLWVTLRIAKKLRDKSRRSVGAKAPEEMAMQEDVVTRLAGEYGADVLVCGHAHRWRDGLTQAGVRWIVLDAFGGERDLLSHQGQEGLVGVSSGFDRRLGG